MVYVPPTNFILGTRNFLTKAWNLERLTPTQKLTLSKCRIYHRSLDRGITSGIRYFKKNRKAEARLSNEMIPLHNVNLLYIYFYLILLFL